MINWVLAHGVGERVTLTIQGGLEQYQPIVETPVSLSTTMTTAVDFSIVKLIKVRYCFPTS